LVREKIMLDEKKPFMDSHGWSDPAAATPLIA
jgi:hypothetical protein